MAGASAVGVTVALMGFMQSLALLAIVVFLFFIAYYAAYEPYRALYPDLLSAEVAGRGQSTQAIFRGAATGTALIGGGLLFSLWPKLPFLAFAVLAFGAMAGVRLADDGVGNRPRAHGARDAHRARDGEHDLGPPARAAGAAGIPVRECAVGAVARG